MILDVIIKRQYASDMYAFAKCDSVPISAILRLRLSEWDCERFIGFCCLPSMKHPVTCDSYNCKVFPEYSKWYYAVVIIEITLYKKCFRFSFEIFEIGLPYSVIKKSNLRYSWIVFHPSDSWWFYPNAVNKKTIFNFINHARRKENICLP